MEELYRRREDDEQDEAAEAMAQFRARRQPPRELELKLTAGEVARAFAMPGNTYGPILSLKEAAKLAKLAPSTLKRLASEGRFRESVKRGKPLRFWRDKFVQELMK
jgi:hypothetical protein